MLFVSCQKGLEPLLRDEITQLGYKCQPSYCGVLVDDMSQETIYTLNYCCRFATRVLFPLGRFKIYDRDSLHKRSKNIEWERYFRRRDQTVAVDANVQHPKFRNSLFAAQVLKDAVCDRLRELKGWRPSVDTKQPDVQLNLFIDDGWATISLDTSGQPLFKRGWRTSTVEAPLQETLAAALLKFAGYTGEQTLCDPFCGSGTILVEAAMMASNTPAGYFRREWGFAKVPTFDRPLWRAVKEKWNEKRRERPAQIWGCDLNPRAAKANLRQFKIPVDTSTTEVADLVVTNPPYGRRVGTRVSLENLPGKRCVVIMPKDQEIEGERLGSVSNGGIPCDILLLRGSH